MSNRFITWAWLVQTAAASEKIVLVRLADFANEDGICWPSVERIADDTSLHERTVRRALDGLARAGLVVMDFRPGQLSQYRLQINSIDTPGTTPAPADQTPGVVPAPVSQTPGTMPYLLDDTPGMTPGTPGTTPGHPGRDAPLTLNEPLRNQRKTEGDPRGSRLPADWKASPEERAYAIDCKLDPDNLEEDFANFWHAKAGAGARKADWRLTWMRWCREQRRRNQQRGGSGFRNGFADLVSREINRRSDTPGASPPNPVTAFLENQS